MSNAKNILAMLMVTGSLWGCSLNQSKEADESQMNLAGSQWQVESIGGKSVIPDSDITIGFTDQGRVYGGASCNRYQGGWSAEGNHLEFSHMAATRMACAAELMDQEDRFLKLLSEAEVYELEADGKLILETASGQMIKATASAGSPE